MGVARRMHGGDVAGGAGELRVVTLGIVGVPGVAEVELGLVDMLGEAGEGVGVGRSTGGGCGCVVFVTPQGWQEDGAEGGGAAGA